MSGEMTAERPRELTAKEKFDRWMVNEGYRRLYVGKEAATKERYHGLIRLLVLCSSLDWSTP